MMFRLLPFRYYNAAENMAIDEAISEGVGVGTSPPTIRFYGWAPAAVSIGCFQSMETEVDIAACRCKNVQMVRRRTGGGAVYHDHSGEITYSVIAPESEMPADINLAYRQICGCIVTALSSLGLEAEFHPINDVLVAGKKISGSAQTRRGGVFLQHGTVLYDLDLPTMFSVLRVGREKLTDKQISSAEERVTALTRHSKASKDELLAALVKAFSADKDVIMSSMSLEEAYRAGELVRSRYANDEWNFSR
jgi:lipoate-protein ligase A